MNNKEKIWRHPAFQFGLVALIIMVFLRPWANEYYASLISWDKLGYYLYLPVAFIYKDWHTLSFIPEYFNNYQPSSYWYQSFVAESGNQVFAYPIGLAIVQAPFFFLGYISALLLGYPVDGFSQPFVFWIYLSGAVYGNLGIYYSYKSLNYFFEKKISYWALVLIFVGTNLLYYCLIDSIMPHSYLFAFYSILIYNTIKWHQEQSFLSLLKISLCVGLMVSIRATEIISIIIPVLWGIFDVESFKSKLLLVQKHISSLVICVLVGSIPFVIQMIYWKYSTGHFIFNPYAYKNLGFSWFDPHLGDFLLSFRKGVFVYAPLLLLACLGVLSISRNLKFRVFKLPFILFLILNLYILSSWDVWWYGGSYGQRSVVQSYAILVFFFAAWIDWTYQYKIFKIISFAFIGICVLVNLSFTWQQDKGIMNSDGITKGMLKESLVYPASGYIPSRAQSNVKSWTNEYIQNLEFVKSIDLSKDPNAVKDSLSTSIIIQPYSFYELFSLNTDSLMKSPTKWIRCSFEMMDMGGDRLQLNNLNLVSEVRGYQNDTRSWKSKTFNYLYKSKEDSNVWKKCEADFEVPHTFRSCDYLHFYFWMNGNKTAQVRNIKFYSLELK